MEIKNLIAQLPWHPTRRWGSRSLTEIQKIIIHQELGEATLESVNAYHTSIGPGNHITPKGCPHICYHYGIRKNGEIAQMNELSNITWHCKGQNTLSIGIMLVGNFSGPGYELGTSEPTDAQMASLEWLVNYLQESFNLSNQEIYGHYHYGKPACPGFVVQDWIENRRNEISARGIDIAAIEKSVKEVQKRLNKLGYAVGKPDGILGIKTTAGIRRFQGDQQLNVDGIVGPQTWKKLVTLTS